MLPKRQQQNTEETLDSMIWSQFLPADRQLTTGRRCWSAGRPPTVTRPVTRQRHARRCTTEHNSAVECSPPQLLTLMPSLHRYQWTTTSPDLQPAHIITVTIFFSQTLSYLSSQCKIVSDSNSQKFEKNLVNYTTTSAAADSVGEKFYCPHALADDN